MSKINSRNSILCPVIQASDTEVSSVFHRINLIKKHYWNTFKQIAEAYSKEFTSLYLLQVKVYHSDQCNDFVLIFTKYYDLTGKYNFHPTSRSFVELIFSYFGFSVFLIFHGPYLCWLMKKTVLITFNCLAECAQLVNVIDYKLL